MNKKTEIRWLIFCAGFFMVFYLAVQLTMPKGSIARGNSVDIEVQYDRLEVPAAYIFPYPVIAILGLNLIFFVLKSLALAGGAFKWMGFVIMLITGFMAGILAMVWGTEFYLNPGDAPVAAFLLPLLLFSVIAFMAFKRCTELIDTGKQLPV